MIVGDDLKEGVFSPLFLNGESLKYVSIYRYLGVNLLAKKHLTFPAHADICLFYRAANSILYCSSSYSNYPDEQVLMKLLHANCVSFLSYACSVKEFDTSDMLSCNTAINMVIRKIFSFARWESVRHLRQTHNCKSIYEIFAAAQTKFSKAALNSMNDIVRHIANCCTVD
jgi:hypothetical protein